MKTSKKQPSYMEHALKGFEKMWLIYVEEYPHATNGLDIGGQRKHLHDVFREACLETTKYIIIIRNYINSKYNVYGGMSG